MVTTLTERYIAATVGNIPPASRDDVQAELEVSIADAIEARTTQGEPHETAEKAVLTGLGDPVALAAGYSDRPLHLIGPRYYLLWWRLLKLLWAIVPAVAMGGVALSGALDGTSAGGIIGSSIAAGITAALQVAFWVTLVLAILERTTGVGALPAWSVERLPEIRTKGAGRADMISSVIFLVLGVGALLWDRFRGFVVHEGDAISLLSPNLWPWWISGLIVLMAAQAAVVIAVHVVGRWNETFAMINTVIALAFATPAMALLATGELFNSEFVALILTNNGVDANSLRNLAIVTGAGLIGFPVWSIIDGWFKTVRDIRHRKSGIIN